MCKRFAILFMCGMRKFLLSIWEIVEVVLISLVTVFIIRTFVAQPFLVSGASMEPNFQNGNYLIIDEVTYRFREPERGDGRDYFRAELYLGRDAHFNRRGIRLDFNAFKVYDIF